MALSETMKALLKAAGKSDAEIAAIEKASSSSSTTTNKSSTKYAPYGQQTVYTPTKAKAFITDQFKALLNREPTAAEVSTWTKKLIAEQKKASSSAVTTYPIINGVRTAVSTTGLDEAQWLTDQINADPKLKTEVEAFKTQAPVVTQNLKDKAVYDKLISDAKGNLDKITAAKQNTTYGRTLAEYEAKIADQIRTAGATNDPGSAAEIAKYLVDRGLSLGSEAAKSYIDAQLKFGKNKVTVGGKTTDMYTGEAGKGVDALNKVALANGLTLDKVFDPASLNDVISAVNAGEDVNTYAKLIRDAAKVAWNVPDNVAKLMDQGVSLDSIYAPYKNAYASTLELSPNQVTLNDLAKMGVIGQPSAGSTAPQNIYDFTKQLRKDDRWQYTQQARQEVADATQKILQDFGFMG